MSKIDIKVTIDEKEVYVIHDVPHPPSLNTYLQIPDPVKGPGFTRKVYICKIINLYPTVHDPSKTTVYQCECVVVT